MARTAEMHRVFAREYIIDLNAKQAAIRAGYSPHTADRQGSRLLRYADVQGYIREEMAARQARTGISQDTVLEELRQIALAPASDAKDSDLRYASKLKALELLGKHLGMWDDKPQVQVAVADVYTADLSTVPDADLRRMLAECGDEQE